MTLQLLSPLGPNVFIVSANGRVWLRCEGQGAVLTLQVNDGLTPVALNGNVALTQDVHYDLGPFHFSAGERIILAGCNRITAYFCEGEAT